MRVGLFRKQTRGTRHGEGVNVVRGLDLAQEMSAPDQYETSAGSVSRSAFNLSGTNEDAHVIFVTVKNEAIVFLIRETAHGIDSGRKVLSIDDTIEG